MIRLTTRPPSRFINCFSQQLKIVFKPPTINLLLRIGCKLIQIIPTQQPNRFLIDETSSSRLVIPHQLVMQPCLFIEVLVLQSERLVRVLINPIVLFQTTPSGIFAVPQQIAVLISHLMQIADLVAVEVMGLLSAFAVFVGPVAYLCQGVVAVVL